VEPGHDDHLVAALQTVERLYIRPVEDERRRRCALVGLARGVFPALQGGRDTADGLSSERHGLRKFAGAGGFVEG
jgi:hypothetical protein